MAKKIKIMLVEDNQDYRDVITLALSEEPDIVPVSQFSSAEVALRSLQNRETLKRPDVILLDLRLPGMGGIASIPFFFKMLPDVKIIILTQSDQEENVLKAIQHGASGYLLKSSTAHQIIEAIHTVINGGASLDASVAKFILSSLKTRLPADELKVSLSDREQDVLALLGDGLVKKEIADQLKISYTTVDTHVRHIYEKLNVRNAPAAVSKAYKTGLL